MFIVTLIVLGLAVYGLVRWNRRRATPPARPGPTPDRAAFLHQLEDLAQAANHRSTSYQQSFTISGIPESYTAIVARRFGPGFDVYFEPSALGNPIADSVVIAPKDAAPRAVMHVPTPEGKFVIDPEDRPTWLEEAERNGRWRVHLPPNRNPDGTATVTLQPMF